MFLAFSPTGGLVVGLSAARFARMTAATAHSHNLFEVVSEQQPDFFPERHIRMKVC